jgi:hypothetical protein
MRLLLSILILTIFLSATAKAQSYFPGHGLALGYAPWQPYIPSVILGNVDPGKKWQVQPYASVEIGYTFFRGGGVSYASVPAGVVVIHPLTSNVSAFAGVAVAPVAFSMNQLYSPSGNNFSRPYGLGGNAAIQAGLIYTNDAKTFSISGSIQVDRGSYPVYPSTRPNTSSKN